MKTTHQVVCSVATIISLGMCVGIGKASVAVLDEAGNKKINAKHIVNEYVISQGFGMVFTSTNTNIDLDASDPALLYYNRSALHFVLGTSLEAISLGLENEILQNAVTQLWVPETTLSRRTTESLQTTENWYMIATAPETSPTILLGLGVFVFMMKRNKG